jgi:hypothetical protein
MNLEVAYAVAYLGILLLPPLSFVLVSWLLT